MDFKFMTSRMNYMERSFIAMPAPCNRLRSSNGSMAPSAVMAMQRVTGWVLGAGVHGDFRRGTVLAVLDLDLLQVLVAVLLVLDLLQVLVAVDDPQNTVHYLVTFRWFPGGFPELAASHFCFSFVPVKTLVAQPVLEQVEKVLMFDLFPLAKGEQVDKDRLGHSCFWPGNALFDFTRLAFAVRPEALW